MSFAYSVSFYSHRISSYKHSKIVLSMLIIALLFLFFSTAIPMASAENYPPPPSGSTVTHETTTTFSGPPATTVTLNVTSTDNQSAVTALNFQFSKNQSSVTVQIDQLSGVPSSSQSPPSSAGKPVLIVFFSVPPQIENNISSIVINFKVPISSLSSLGLSPGSSSLVVERYSNSSKTWTSLPTTVTGSDSKYIYLKATSPGLSLFAIAASPTAQSSTTASSTSSASTSTSTSSTSSSNNSLTVSVAIVVVILIALVGSFFIVARRRRSA